MSKKALDEAFIKAVSASKKRKGPRISKEALGALGVSKTKLTANNKRRIKNAKAALENFRKVTKSGPSEEHQTLLVDLLTDMRHYASRDKDVDFEAAIRVSEGHFVPESQGDDS